MGRYRNKHAGRSRPGPGRRDIDHDRHPGINYILHNIPHSCVQTAGGVQLNNAGHCPRFLGMVNATPDIIHEHRVDGALDLEHINRGSGGSSFKSQSLSY